MIDSFQYNVNKIIFLILIWLGNLSFQSQVVSHNFTYWDTKASGTDYTNCLKDNAYSSLNVLTQTWFGSTVCCKASPNGVFSVWSGGP